MRVLILSLAMLLSSICWAQPNPRTLQVEHVVRKKETLYRISKEYGMTVSELRELNPNVGVIKPGMRLKVRKKLRVGKRKRYITHEVQKNETLYRLSVNYKVKVADIREANGFIDDNIQIGQVIKIPASHLSEEVPVPVEVNEETMKPVESPAVRGGIIEPGTFTSNKTKYTSKEQVKTLYMIDTASRVESSSYNKAYVWIKGLKQNQVVAIHDKSTDQLIYAIVKGTRPKQGDDTIIASPFVFEKLEVKSRFTDVTLQYVVPEDPQ